MSTIMPSNQYAEEVRAGDPEAQPLLLSNDSDNKHERSHTPVDLGPTPRGLGPIQLEPDEGDPPTGSRWNFNNMLQDVAPEHRSILRDIGKGCIMVLGAPIAFAGVGLYACGVVIEGIAIILKGIGSFGGMFLVKMRRMPTQSASPRAAEAWV